MYAVVTSVVKIRAGIMFASEATCTSVVTSVVKIRAG